MQDSYSHSRQPPCYGPWIQNYQCCQQTEPMTSVSNPTTETENIKTPEPTCMHNCTKPHAPDRAFCPAKDSTHQSCGKIGHWDARTKAPPVDRRIQARSNPDIDTMVENKSRHVVLM